MMNQSQDRQTVEAFLMNCKPLQVIRYSYLEVQKATNSFKEKIGQGGYGSVYKGKSNDGCLVAVKGSKVSRYGRAADLAPTIECVDSKPTMILEEA
ncbi:hypothetical protein Prudu_1280S000300 [Prunus dulcis]|uniref:Uncharacterized protein n=1 Tax=Prunus dulcis TaxID=3755 RepID=A0A5H2XTU5_PRUDU|nr:hypothetical protein Prudu_1280S000300 [Prunus dulcis]